MIVHFHRFRTYYFEDPDYARAFADYWNAQLVEPEN